MTNAFDKTTLIWEVSTNAKTLLEKAPNFNNPTVRQVILIPSGTNQAVNFQNDSSEDAIYLKGGASDASPVRISFEPDGKRVHGLKVTTLSSGAKAWVYLK